MPRQPLTAESRRGLEQYGHLIEDAIARGKHGGTQEQAGCAASDKLAVNFGRAENTEKKPRSSRLH